MLNPLIQSFSKNLKPCSGCGKNLSDPSYDYLWSKQKENDMEYVATITVTAESIEEALQAIKDGKGKTLSINPRPQQPTIRTSTGSVSGSPSK